MCGISVRIGHRPIKQNRESRSIPTPILSGLVLYNKSYTTDKQGKNTLFQKNGVLSIGYANRKNFNLPLHSHLIYKIISSMGIAGLNVKSKTIKIL